MILKLQSPGAGSAIGLSGVAYTPDANGIITVLNSGDIASLLNAGWQVVMASSGAASVFGSGGQPFFAEGNLCRHVGNPLAQPLATGVDSILDQFTLLPNSFDQAGRGLLITAQGSFAATVNAKRVKIFFNPTIVGNNVTAGTPIADSGASTGSGVGWGLYATVFKYGAANSNTQIGQGQPVVAAVHGGISLPVALTATENGAIVVCVTGNATTVTTDISANLFEINAVN